MLKGANPAGRLGVREGVFGQSCRSKLAVEDVDRVGSEIGRVQSRSIGAGADGQPFIDGAGG